MTAFTSPPSFAAGGRCGHCQLRRRRTSAVLFQEAEDIRAPVVHISVDQEIGCRIESTPDGRVAVNDEVLCVKDADPLRDPSDHGSPGFTVRQNTRS